MDEIRKTCKHGVVEFWPETYNLILNNKVYEWNPTASTGDNGCTGSTRLTYGDWMAVPYYLPHQCHLVTNEPLMHITNEYPHIHECLNPGKEWMKRNPEPGKNDEWIPISNTPQ